MSIFRVEKTKNFTIMSNLHFKEKQMSLKAKGLLSLMLSLPDTWNYTLAGLVSICKENETAIKNTLNELKEFGYLKVVKQFPTKENGGRMSYEYIIYENPIQGGKNQGVETLPVDDPSLLNINKLNTNNNINIINNNISTSSENNNANNTSIIKSKRKSKKQLEEEKQLQNDLAIQNLITNYTKDPALQELLERYVCVRKEKGLLTSAQFTIMLENLKKECGDNISHTKDCVRMALAGGWSQIVFINNKFKGNTKANYSSFDNTSNHFTGNQKITDEQFNQMSFEDKKYYINMMSVADMTPLQKEFFNEYCLARDENGNLLTF